VGGGGGCGGGLGGGGGRGGGGGGAVGGGGGGIGGGGGCNSSGSGGDRGPGRVGGGRDAPPPLPPPPPLPTAPPLPSLMGGGGDGTRLNRIASIATSPTTAHAPHMVQPDSKKATQAHHEALFLAPRCMSDSDASSESLSSEPEVGSSRSSTAAVRKPASTSLWGEPTRLLGMQLVNANCVQRAAMIRARRRP